MPLEKPLISISAITSIALRCFDLLPDKDNYAAINQTCKSGIACQSRQSLNVISFLSSPVKCFSIEGALIHAFYA